MTHYFGARSTVLFLGLLLAIESFAAAPTSELQKTVRGATFEVVMPKPVNDSLTYEKPLPLELIPFTERNDKYWSIGTAFAIDNDSFISAGHVLLASIGSRSGPPALRDSSGHVYTIDRILKFSLHEDFVVFSVKSPPPLAPLAVNRQPQIDDGVFAVGNALGDGIVIRDGLFTSETAEQQDGRWKWIRFSAAASPGNSGGPLLDTQGRVIGIVIGKSDNENLNYALPITRLLDAPAKRASIDTRWLQHLPVMNATTTATWKQEFDLPKSFVDFSKTYTAALNAAHIKERKRLIDSQVSTMFPKGNGSAKLLANVVDARFPKLVAQRKDDSWHLLDASDTNNVELTNEGFVRAGYTAGAGLVQIRLPGHNIDAKFYRDSVASMDLALKALRLARPVGADTVRVTSVGPARSEMLWPDAHGRRWQVRTWSLDYMSSDLIAFMLPVPSGYIALVDTNPAGGNELALEELKSLANLTYVSYSGSLQQWREYLAQKDLRAMLFDKIKIDWNATRGLSYQSPRLSLTVPPSVIGSDERNHLVLRTTFLQENNQLLWDVGGIGMSEDAQENTFMMATRQPKPLADADKESEQQWQRLRDHKAPYNNLARPNPDRKSFWIATAIGALRGNSTELDPDNKVLYEVTYSTDADVLPRDLEDRQRLMLRGTRILER